MKRRYIKGELPPKSGRYRVRYNGVESYDHFYAGKNIWWCTENLHKPEEVEWDPDSYMPI